MSGKPRCCARVFTKYSMTSSQCSRAAVVAVDGKHYCKQHDPVKIKAKREARTRLWEQHFAEANKRRTLERAAPDLLEALEILLAVVNEVANSRGWPDNTPRHKARAAIAKAKGEA